jgi:dipeptidyl aminopeptidase/acylaminoacyl peptidase
MSKISRPFGLWESPITPKSLSAGIRLSEVKMDPLSDTLVWLEGRSAHTSLMMGTPGGGAARSVSGDLPVRAQVGYGGGAFDVRNGQIAFFGGKKNRLYMVSVEDGSPHPVTPCFGGGASPQISPNGDYIAYVHHDEDDRDRIGIVDSKGMEWPQILHQGEDFYTQIRFSPDQTKFAFVAWNHPNMPWDGSTLYLGDFTTYAGVPRLENIRPIGGGDECAVFQPEFSPDSKTLYYVSDAPGVGEFFAFQIESGETRQLTTAKNEHGCPNWVQEMRTYAVTKSGKEIYCAVNDKGFSRVTAINTQTGQATVVEPLKEYTNVAQLCSNERGNAIAFVGSSSVFSARVVHQDLIHQNVTVLARASGERLPRASLSEAAPIQWESDGTIVHGLYYGPRNGRFESAGLPPLVVLVHGGPTSQAMAGWDDRTLFFTTRGFAVLQVNHRGSTGYGRDYMTSLRGNWGLYDVEDSASGALFLAESGRVDRKRLVIMGGSAGGYTVLQTMSTKPEVFTAGISLYGIADQFALVQATHKFEAHYNDSLLGVLPEASELFRERSPLTHAKNITQPLAIFQGDKDQAVPMDQAEAIVGALKRNGTSHTYTLYEGEGHGFRKSATIEHLFTTVEKFLKQHVIYI